MNHEQSFCSRNKKEMAARQRKRSLHTLLEQDSAHTSTIQCDTLDLRPDMSTSGPKKRLAQLLLRNSQVQICNKVTKNTQASGP